MAQVPARREAWVLVGAVCGLTWAAGFRDWRAELAKGESSSSVTSALARLRAGTVRHVGGPPFSLTTIHGIWVSTL
jgi:hypothetical protein